MKNLVPYIDQIKALEETNWLFMHRTDAEAINHILEEGFKYENSFTQTSDIVISETDYLDYWLRARKRYGQFIVLFAIDKEVIHFGGSLDSKFGFNGLNVDMLASEIDEEDFDHILAREYVYGIYDLEGAKWQFNPSYEACYV